MKPVVLCFFLYSMGLSLLDSEIQYFKTMHLDWWCESWSRSVRVHSSHNQLRLSLDQMNKAEEFLILSTGYENLAELFLNTSVCDDLDPTCFSRFKDNLFKEYQRKEQLISTLAEIFNFTDGYITEVRRGMPLIF